MISNKEAIKVLKRMSIPLKEFSQEAMAISKAIELLEKAKPKTCGQCMDFWKCRTLSEENNPFAEECLIFKERK